MKTSAGCKTQDPRCKAQDLRLETSDFPISCFLSSVLCLASCVCFVALLGIMGCGEESPTDRTKIEPITTGISGTTYLNVEHGFKLPNLPASGWVIRTRKYRDGSTESVLLMAFTTEDTFTFDTSELVDKQIPYTEVLVYGPNPDLPTKPDIAKEIMDIWIATWEWMGIEVISRKPVAGSNTTGYEAILSMPMADAAWIVKWAFFAKHDRGYIISFWAPEDKYIGLVAHIDPIISSFELLGR